MSFTNNSRDADGTGFIKYEEGFTYQRNQIMTYIHDLFTPRCIEWEKITCVLLMGSSAQETCIQQL